MENVTVKTRSQAKVGTKAYTEFEKLGVVTVAVFAGLVGVWALTSLAFAASTVGLAGLVKGFFVAVGLV